MLAKDGSLVTGANQDHFVGFHHLTILTGQGDISEIFVPSEISKGSTDVLLKLIPLKTQLLWVGHGMYNGMGCDKLAGTGENDMFNCHT